MPKRVTKTRDSGIELLRIIAVFMVIGVHLFAYSHYKNQSIEIGGIVESMSFGIRVLFMPCVNIFVIITGYFMVKMKFNLERAYKRVFKT
ncbi:MAG: acyltransferase family protein, partial [Lachnospiraceae bacterium]|nr:acyltransferase family protein [Lachnospiraceae bacterium]